jgi:hypothetical protein
LAQVFDPALFLVAAAACTALPVSTSQSTSAPLATPAAASSRRADGTPAGGVGATSGSTLTQALRGPTFILLRGEDLTSNAQLGFSGQGFLPGEKTLVTIEDAKGRPEAKLDPVTPGKEGQIDEVSVAIPPSLAPGQHTLHVEGTTSGRAARATFRLQRIPPEVKPEVYTAKPGQAFGFSGGGFVPGEDVDVFLGGLKGTPLATFRADVSGNVAGKGVVIPPVQAGDYPLHFVGRQSQTPFTVGFNVQGFSPFMLLDNYSPPPYYRMGFKGEDFTPGDQVLVYLGPPSEKPLARLEADARGKIDAKAVWEVPELHGDATLTFVAQGGGQTLTAKFVVLPFGPALELTDYAGRPGSPVAFIGSGWARNETLHAFVGEGRQAVGTFRADGTGAFKGAGGFHIPVRLGPGGQPVTVVGEVSKAEVTIWYQVLELQPSAELSAYQGPVGTVVSFTGRGFAGGERVQVHLKEKDGRLLAEATAGDDGVFERVSAYPVEGQSGEVIPFVFVGADSSAQATTHFRLGSP